MSGSSGILLFSSPYIEKANRTCHDRRPVLIHGDELPSIFGSFGSGEQFLDRKFASRWVLFSEGDEGGMSMTGYISSPISRMVLCS